MLYLNGKIISNSDATIPTNDRGFLLGDGLFETIRCAQGSPAELEAHWNRLAMGANYLQLPLLLSMNEAQHNIEKLLAVNNLNQSAGARITITRGAGARGISIPQHCTPTILITVFPRNKNTGSTSLCSSHIRINEQSPFTRFKTLNYLDKIIARQQAQNNGFGDALLLNTKEHVVSATTANIFFVKGKTLHTPAIEEGALPGITRQKIIHFAAEQHIACEEGTYMLKDLLTATEVFITNSIIGVHPVNAINKIKFNALPKPTHERFHALFE